MNMLIKACFLSALIFVVPQLSFAHPYHHKSQLYDEALKNRSDRAIEMQKEYTKKNCISLLILTEDSIVKFHNHFSYFMYFNTNSKLTLDDQEDPNTKQALEVYNIYNIMIGNLSHAIDVCKYVEGYDDVVEKLIRLQHSEHEFHKYLEIILFSDKEK